MFGRNDFEGGINILPLFRLRECFDFRSMFLGNFCSVTEVEVTNSTGGVDSIEVADLLQLRF